MQYNICGKHLSKNVWIWFITKGHRDIPIFGITNGSHISSCTTLHRTETFKFNGNYTTCSWAWVLKKEDIKDPHSRLFAKTPVVIDGFASQTASNAENTHLSRRNHGKHREKTIDGNVLFYLPVLASSLLWIIRSRQRNVFKVIDVSQLVN